MPHVFLREGAFRADSTADTQMGRTCMNRSGRTRRMRGRWCGVKQKAVPHLLLQPQISTGPVRQPWITADLPPQPRTSTGPPPQQPWVTADICPQPCLQRISSLCTDVN
eukprot:350703-Chlamydomonas_euryale.AAC.2